MSSVRQVLLGVTYAALAVWLGVATPFAIAYLVEH